MSEAKTLETITPSSYEDMAETFPVIEQGVVIAALDLLDGPATKEQKERMQAFSDYYRHALNAMSAAKIEQSIVTHGDETLARTELICHVEESAQRIVSAAQYEYYKESHIERARYFLAQTKLRRTVSSTAIGVVVGGGTTIVEKGIQHTPGLEKLYALSLGAGAVGLAFNTIRPRKIINSVVNIPGNRLKRQANRGIQQYDTNTLRQIREQVKQIQDKETAQKISYELITKETIINLLNSSLCVSMISDRLQTTEQIRAASIKAGDITVDWLLAFYGLESKSKAV